MHLFTSGISGNTVVGTVVDIYNGGFNKGFIESGGVFTTLSHPNGENSTEFTGISGSMIVGNYGENGTAFAFTLSEGLFTNFNIPNARHTTITGISGSTIFGYYYDSNMDFYGFTESDGVFTTLNHPNAEWGTYITGISDSTIVGYYRDSNYSPVGFIATAVPEPSTYALFGIGALALIVAYRRKVV
jgi:hypothetical protein